MASRSLSVRVLPDLIAFGFWLTIAYSLEWELRDLVWSLWLSSLVLGYLTILSILAAGAYFGFGFLRDRESDRAPRKPAILASSVAGLFFLGFFSLHFCGFHAGHSVFLSMFFPLDGMPQDGFGAAFMNPPYLWVLVFRHLMEPYGLFLVPALISERRRLFGPLSTMVQRMGTEETAGSDTRHPFPMKDAMSRPYVNVIRMHLLIFFFAFCHALKLDNFLVYAVVYSVYFFPWSELRGWPAPRSGHAKVASAPQDAHPERVTSLSEP